MRYTEEDPWWFYPTPRSQISCRAGSALGKTAVFANILLHTDDPQGSLRLREDLELHMLNVLLRTVGCSCRETSYGVKADCHCECRDVGKWTQASDERC